MRASRSEPTIKGPRYNIGNGYGQYCLLDDPQINRCLSTKSNGKIKINIVTPNSSESELSDEDSTTSENKNDKYKDRNKIFLAGVYLTTAAFILFEYWYCFTPLKTS
jgi:hypothetical protein